MSKILLIIQREYRSRVMKKSFLILTFLTPLLFAGLVTTPFFLSRINSNSQHIYVLDQTGLYSHVLTSGERYKYHYINLPIDQIKQHDLLQGDFEALLCIYNDLSKHPDAATLYSKEQVNLELKNDISAQLNKGIIAQKLSAYQIPNLPHIIENLKKEVQISTIKWDENGTENRGSSELAMGIGMATALAIYMFIVIYGAQIMNSVVHEKVNRIVEVIITSVKPTQLMLGKIIGVALVGLTQILLWTILTQFISTIISIISGIKATDLQANSPYLLSQSGLTQGALQINEILSMLHSFNLPVLFLCFVLFFIGGYLLYASLFAAIGAAVDSETDTHQFSFPLTLPILFAVYSAIYSAQNPDGPLAMWCSMIPFTSPVVMMVRLPYGVPTLQIILSLLILTATCITSIWIAGKIYRTNILMYGKKNSWKEIWKWLSY